MWVWETVLHPAGGAGVTRAERLRGTDALPPPRVQLVLGWSWAGQAPSAPWTAAEGSPGPRRQALGGSVQEKTVGLSRAAGGDGWGRSKDRVYVRSVQSSDPWAPALMTH